MKETVLGIDIGGTNIKYGWVNSQGEILLTKEISTNSFHELSDFISLVREELKQTSLEEKFSVKAIGIGVPNGNAYDGNITNAPNLPWKGIVPLQKEIERQTHITCQITNDANAAALGEYYFGSAKDCSDFLVVTLGTGVGSGFVSKGKLLYGHTGFAGELGHSIVFPNGIPHWSTGVKGTLEAYASATALVRNYRNLLKGQAPSQISAQDITELAIQGQTEAVEALGMLSEALGLGLANAVAITSPEKIIITGGLAQAWDVFMPNVITTFGEHVFPVFADTVIFEKSGLEGSSSAVLGAASLVMHHISP